jgi:hypothetical protein
MRICVAIGIVVLISLNVMAESVRLTRSSSADAKFVWDKSELYVGKYCTSTDATPSTEYVIVQFCLNPTTDDPPLYRYLYFSVAGTAIQEYWLAILLDYFQNRNYIQEEPSAPATNYINFKKKAITINYNSTAAGTKIKMDCTGDGVDVHEITSMNYNLSN